MTAGEAPGAPEVSRLGSVIQHTLIKEGVAASKISEHCREAVEWSFDAVMVPGIWVGLCRRELAGTSVKVASAWTSRGGR